MLTCFLEFQTDRMCTVLELGGLLMVQMVYGPSLYLNNVSTRAGCKFQIFSAVPNKGRRPSISVRG